MPTKFLESLSSKLAEKWLTTILTPAFIFWGGGLGAWIYRHDWLSVETWFSQQSQTAQITLLIIALLTIITSALIVQYCELAVLRMLEGYWFRWLRKLRYCFIIIQQKRKYKLDRQFQSLIARTEDKKQPPTPEEIEEYARLDGILHYFPIHLMPTQFGMR